MKKSNAIEAYRLISEAKLSKLEVSEKIAVIRAAAKLKPASAQFDDFLKEARERLKPEGWEQTEAQAAKFADLDDAAKAAVNRAVGDYNRAVQECAAKELAEEWAAEYPRISEEAYGRLLESNPEWSVAQAMAAQDALC